MGTEDQDFEYITPPRSPKVEELFLHYLAGVVKSDVLFRLRVLFEDEFLLLISEFCGERIHVPSMKRMTKILGYCEIFVDIVESMPAYKDLEEACQEVARRHRRRAHNVRAVVDRVLRYLDGIQELKDDRAPEEFRALSQRLARQYRDLLFPESAAPAKRERRAKRAPKPAAAPSERRRPRREVDEGRARRPSARNPQDDGQRERATRVGNDGRHHPPIPRPRKTGGLFGIPRAINARSGRGRQHPPQRAARCPQGAEQA